MHDVRPVTTAMPKRGRAAYMGTRAAQQNAAADLGEPLERLGQTNHRGLAKRGRVR